MEMEQESEWNAAQNISISEDLVTAAKHQLQFLAVVDRNRWLYESQCLQWAIYRYNACWLPLVAKHSESRVTEGPLVVPLDCEWVWHCHRLNPVRYKSDCEEFYGRILDNCNVVSSVQGISSRDTEEIWSKLYPNEPYDFDLARPSSSEFSETVYGTQSFSKYNFILAIERQSPFFYQVSRPHVNNDLFLQAAFARYKGFLHLIRRNRERSIRRFCVPTYDIDLIWHTHQLHPASYCNDLVELLGNVLEHDDTDQNRGKGQKLDTGFSETTKQWEETFGSRYWRAGAMYRGIAPSPITTTPCIPEIASNKADSTNELERLIDIPKTNYIEILLQCVEIKNLPEIHKGKVGVLFSKAQPDGIFNVKRKLSIQSELGQKQVAVFQCQPMGYLFFELVSQSKKTKTLGSCFISMEELSGPVSKLSVEKWLDVVPSSGTVGSEPIQLRVAASCTLPTPAPHVVQMLRSSPLSKTHCFFPLCGMVRFTRSWTRIIDAAGYEIIRLQMRENKKSAKEIFGLTRTGETLVLAQFLGKEWSVMDSLWSFKLPNSNDQDAHLLLTGPRMVKLVSGRKLDYEPKHNDKRGDKHSFMTAVEFSADHPYGRAVALLDLKSGLLTVSSSFIQNLLRVSGLYTNILSTPLG
ncbi:glycine-rich domain-containing protein 1 isoform X1 [Cynara cardunculus var. scolymus]|uniref:glycine-rich domain-containing protein 1 isoform X1 n=1 Tax=Cynara cardunculus var. scolymus TaxID=59895 RepID=UPI000D62576B|nr:glycine-rich domain-containing protein 1 isoform X1 [Cynara cardunculus var. scolymus]XP_024977763.1 glycine-rich domain-containing protein 1 isoform X1 [Cynara cardunculus var. scolymus]